MWLVRKASKARNWNDLTEDQVASGVTALAAVRECMERELSVYEVDDPSNSDAVAVAMNMSSTEFPMDTLMLAATRQSVEEAGFRIDASKPGATRIADVDRAHRDVIIPDIGHAALMATLFARGQAVPFTKAQIESKTTEMLRAGRVNLTEIVRKRASNPEKVILESCHRLVVSGNITLAFI